VTLLQELGRQVDQASRGVLDGNRHVDLWPAKAHLLDALALILAARRHPFVVRAASARLPLDPGATTAFRAGVACDALGLDDFDEVTRTHPGAVVVAALLGATADSDEPISGATLLAGLVAGYEVTCRFGEVADGGTMHNRGLHPTSVCGVLGGAAAVALLRGTDPAAAIGLAGSLAAGIFELDEPGAVKGLQVGWAAQASLTAAALAATGYRPAEGAMDGPMGLLATLGRPPRDSHPVAEATAGRLLERVSFKPYCHFTDLHPATAALVRLLARSQPGAADIAEIDVHLPAGGGSRLSTEFPPASARLARRCPRFTLGAVVCRADRELPTDPMLDVFKPEALHDPEILAIAERVRWHTDLPSGAGSPAATIVMRLRNGESRTASASGYPGDGRRPESRWGWAEIVQRTSRLTPEHARSLIGQVAALDSVLDVRPLTAEIAALLRP